MSFYILFNEKFKEHHFEYINETDDSRLEKTLPRGQSQTAKSSKSSKNHHAIEIMSKNIQSVEDSLPVSEAMRILVDKKIHHLPVIDRNNKFLGLVSDRDLLKLNGDKLFNLIQVKDIKSSIVIACHEETEISQVAKVLIHENISALPVLDDSMNLSGIISRVDLLKCVVYQAKFFE